MEHIIQFGVSIDDNAIINKTTELAVAELKKELKAHIIDATWRGGSDFTPAAERVFKETIEDMKPEIVELAATKLAESLGRSPKFREKVAAAIGEQTDETDG